MKFIFLILLTIAALQVYTSEGRAQASTLNTKCEQPKFACGECETKLQDDFQTLMNKFATGAKTGSRWDEATGSFNMAPGTKIDDFIRQTADMMRADNTGAPGKLNYIVMGRSDSTQKATPGNPRILMKSPNSELWVSFNTDPKAPGYNTVEIMRWDGKSGSYKLQELNFGGGAGRGPHADLSPTSCRECHREPVRPNWDTYRSWAGIIPPRDDYLEPMTTGNSSRGFDSDQLSAIAKHDSKVNTSPDPNARAYFNFLDRVANARAGLDTDTDARLKALDILYSGDAATDKDKISAIRNQISSTGFYRVPHFPEKEGNLNYSSKTAPKAGASHVAFDQLMGQQLCQVATGLKNNPNFDKFKYAIAGLLYCERPGKEIDSQALNQYLPTGFDTIAKNYFQTSPTLSTSTGRVPIGGAEGATLQAVYEHTRQSHALADSFKIRRQSDFVTSYLTTVENMGSARAGNEARRLSDTTTSQVSYPYSAIRDPGGVRGVAESDTGLIAEMRYVLEPLGVDPANWSMQLADGVADKSYAFSDQFSDILSEQK